LTVSIGISGFVSGLSWEEWMKRCDENLYQAKKSGRNQVVSQCN
jgi:diguanylate cyclase (GGDEF)-like protein